MTAPEVRTPGGSRASADELGNSGAIVALTTPGDNPDDATGLDQFDDERSGLARIRAALAKRGYSLLETNCGYLIARWGWSRIAPDMSAVGRFLKQVGGQQ